MEKKRLAFPDAAKGMAIIAVIIGHSLSLKSTDVTHLLNNFIFSFHMPLFFMVSGYFYSSNNAGGGRKTARSAKSLLIPFIALALFAFIEQIIVNPNYNITENLFSIFYANSSPLRSKEFLNNMPVIGMEWFLMALFLCRVIYIGIDTFGKKYNISVSLLALVVFLAGVALNEYIWLPFSIQPAMGAVLFYHIGYELRKREIITDSDCKSKACIVIFSAAIWIFAILFGSVRMNANLYDNFLSVLGAVCGSFIILLAAKYIAKIPIIGKFFTWAGRYSIVIFCIHKIESGCKIGGNSALVHFTKLFTDVHSYHGLLLYLFIRITVVLIAAFIFTKLRDIYKRHKTVSSPQ